MDLSSRHLTWSQQLHDMISLQHTTCMGDCSKKHMLDCLLGSCWGRWGKKPGPEQHGSIADTSNGAASQSRPDLHAENQTATTLKCLHKPLLHEPISMDTAPHPPPLIIICLCLAHHEPANLNSIVIDHSQCLQ